MLQLSVMDELRQQHSKMAVSKPSSSALASVVRATPDKPPASAVPEMTSIGGRGLRYRRRLPSVSDRAEYLVGATGGCFRVRAGET